MVDVAKGSVNVTDTHRALGLGAKIAELPLPERIAHIVPQANSTMVILVPGIVRNISNTVSSITSTDCVEHVVVIGKGSSANCAKTPQCLKGLVYDATVNAASAEIPNPAPIVMPKNRDNALQKWSHQFLVW